MSFESFESPQVDPDTLVAGDAVVTSVLDAIAQPQAPAVNAFAELGLVPEIVWAIERAGYENPTSVQAQAIPAALAGRDLMVSSQTGSGKTAAFVLPALQRILAARNDPAKRRAKGAPCGPRVLVLTPTRELAMQVTRACDVYGRGVNGLRVASVLGGVPYGAQIKALRSPLDILIATPGRLLDLMGSGAALLAQTELLILDEADRMLDMGFIDDIQAIAQAIPENRQTLMFSATFGGHVGGLAGELTRDPQRITLATARETHASIEQRLYWADSLSHKVQLLEHLLADPDVDQALVFTSTQRDADIVADRLAELGHPVASLHGAMPQARRTRVLQGLRQRQLRILVATDVASRGIDVPTITHVINFGLPMKTEDYVHRIGRTGRAGRTGLAITLAERRDISMIRRIEHFTTQPIKVATIAGLEPKMAAPARPDRNSHRPGTPRPQTGYGPKFGGKFAGGGAGRDQPRFNDRGGDRFGAPAAPAFPAHPFGAPNRGGDRVDAAPAYRTENRPAFGDSGMNDRGPGFNRGPRHDGPDNGPRGGFGAPRSGPRRNDR